MQLYHIVATAEGRVIGKANRLPWHFSSDLKHFKALTLGSTVIMGRKTFESLGSRPLPGRQNFVLSRKHPSPLPAGRQGFPSPQRGEGGGEGKVRFFTSLEEALKNVSTEKAFITGGAELYRQTMDKIDGIWLTRISGEYEGDTFYPEISLDQFEIKTREKCKEDPQLEFIYYERKR